MNKNVQVTQKATLGAQTTQIAMQNNYVGMTAEQASELAIKLFTDNFPKLQDKAKEIAHKRAEELCCEAIGKLSQQYNPDFSVFSNPDMQFVLNRAQQEYARFGTKELCSLLSDIIVNRVNYENNYYVKLLLDDAVDVAKSLSENHLNYLSIIFLTKQVVFHSIDSIKSLEEHLNYICEKLPVKEKAFNSIPLLEVMRLLSLRLGMVEEIYAKNYKLNENEVKEILPSVIDSISGDYELSPLGIVIAIINIREKTHFNLDFETWINPM